MTAQAREALEQAEVVVGYSTYIHLAAPFLAGKKVLSSGMRRETERAQKAVEMALAGYNVVVVSSGDPGVYGMAGPVLEAAPEDLDVRVIPGVTAASAAAALLGAPLMHDFAVISLSDLLTPWETIARRLEAAAVADFVIVLYNPRSRSRDEHLLLARNIILAHRQAETPLGLVKNCGRAGQEVILTTLGDVDITLADMFTTVVVGNSRTRVAGGKMITPRGYGQ